MSRPRKPRTRHFWGRRRQGQGQNWWPGRLSSCAISIKHTVYDTSHTRINSYRGPAVQPSIPRLTCIPSDVFQGSVASSRSLVWTTRVTSMILHGAWMVLAWAMLLCVLILRIKEARVSANDSYLWVSFSIHISYVVPHPFWLDCSLWAYPPKPLLSTSWQTIDTSTIIFPSEYFYLTMFVLIREDQDVILMIFLLHKRPSGGLYFFVRLKRLILFCMMVQMSICGSRQIN